MFDKLIRTLKQFEEPQKISISMKIEADADGYIDKECPSEKCCFSFKVGERIGAIRSATKRSSVRFADTLRPRPSGTRRTRLNGLSRPLSPSSKAS